MATVGTDECTVWGQNNNMVDREGLSFTKRRNEYGRVAWIFSRRGVYDWLTEKEYTEYLLGNEDDEYGGMIPPVRTEY